MHPSVRVPCVSTNQALQTGGLHYANPPSPSPEDQTSEVGGPRAGLLQRLQRRVLPASSSFWGLWASIPGLVAASLPSLAPSPRGFSAVSPLFCVLQGPVMGIRVTLISGPSLQHTRNGLISGQGLIQRFWRSRRVCGGHHLPSTWCLSESQFLPKSGETATVAAPPPSSHLGSLRNPDTPQL